MRIDTTPLTVEIHACCIVTIVHMTFKEQRINSCNTCWRKITKREASDTWIVDKE